MARPERFDARPVSGLVHARVDTEDTGEQVLGDDLGRRATGYLTPEDEPADTPFELIVVQDTDADTGTTTAQN